jgi:GAF domain-containing protein
VLAGAVLRLARDAPVRPGDVALFETLATHAAIAIENARLVDALRRRNDEAQADPLAQGIAQPDQPPADTLHRDEVGDLLHRLRRPGLRRRQSQFGQTQQLSAADAADVEDLDQARRVEDPRPDFSFQSLAPVSAASSRS